jgi:Signal transduction histidine kinase
MGPVAAIVGEHQRIAALDFAILVVYLLFTLYFGLLHFFDRKNSWEWLSLFFFFLAVVVSVNSTKWLSYLLPFLSFHATVTIYWIARIGLNYCVFIFVYRRCQRRVDKWLKKLVLLISCAFIGMILVFPPDQATQYIAAWNLVSTLMYIFILVLLIWSLRSKEEGAWYEFLAFCLFASEALLNALIIFGITEQGGWYFFQNFSFLVVISFLFLQQVILAYRKTEKITQEMLLVDKFKNEFMASISEQMVTPLNAMISIADARLHEDDKLTPDQRHDLRIITSVGWTIRSMVNDLLDFSRLRNKTILLQVRPIDFRSVVNEGIERLYYLDFDHSVLFENKIPLGFPPILADEERMDQLLMSILIHAQKKVIRGKIIIEASVKEPFADISIRLQGEGMTE